MRTKHIVQMVMNAKPIIFRQGEENGIVVERDHFENSIMLNQYQQAISIFHHMWERQKVLIDALGSDKEHKNVIWIDNKFSNIIAFCGDRGEGKSSCMASFATMLTDANARNEAVNAKETIPVTDPKTHETKEVSQKLFCDLDKLIGTEEIEWLDVIDPSFFDDDHNLLELLLGRICEKANWKSKDECENDCTIIAKHRKLMEQLEKVKRCITTMTPQKDKKIFDSVESISDLASGMQLKEELQTLFRCYLQLVGKKCLLICVDDLDLSFEQGYKMAEMLRKYLINPYCVILVSVKVEQLIDIIAAEHQHIVNGTELKWDYCKQVAQKYVAKLLPRGNRVVMPVAEDFCERELQIADNNGHIDIKEPVYSVKEKVVQMIFQKTGYVFYNTQHLSPIIPRNLRSLRHLLGLLCTLPDARDENWDDDETGREAFKDYFFGTWCIEQLSDKDYAFAKKLANYDDLSTMNAYVVEHFAKRVKNDEKIEIEKSDVKDEYIKLYLNIISNQNTAVNISYGDVMYVLWLINSITLRTEIQNLIFFIKTIYSMRLYACYNVISQGASYLFPPTPEVEKVVQIHKAETLYEHVNQLQRLVNGSYFTYPQGKLLPQNDKYKDFRDRKAVSFDKLKKKLNDLADAYSDSTRQNSKEFLEDLRLFEYIALCITRTTNNTEQTEEKGLNRIEKVPTYLGAFSNTAHYAIFDFMQPFYSLCNIEYAYRRFDGILSQIDAKLSLYTIALKTKDSLLNQLHTKQIARWENKHNLISDAVIRITDVQWAIFEELLRTQKLHKNGNESISAAYKDIINLKIKLYPRIRIDNKGKDPYVLKFSFLSTLSSILDENNLNKLQELLNWSKMDEISKQTDEFARNITKLLGPIPTRALSLTDIRQVVRDAAKTSGMELEKRRRLYRGVTGIFSENRDYSVQEISAKIIDLMQIYYSIAINM